MQVTRSEIAGLTTRIVGPTDAATTVVLLHGFGAPGDDLVPVAGEIASLGLPRRAASRSDAQSIEAPSVRFVFPEAPLELGGLYGDSRAWWLLDLAKLERELAAGEPRDHSDEIPEGLASARAQVGRLLDQLEARYGVTADRLVLGGFSQGAMLALDVALHRDAPPAALLLMSGTIVAESEWAARMTRLAHVPVLLSHGRADGLLPFAVAEKLRDRLRAAGAEVDWHPFVGGHQIPQQALAAAADLLRRRATSG